MIIFDEVCHRNDALFVSLHLLKEIVRLQLSEDFNYCSLHTGSCHQTSVIRSGKPFFSDLDSLDRFHSVANSVALLCHELTCCSISFVE